MPNCEQCSLRVCERPAEKFDCASSCVVSFGNCVSAPVQHRVILGHYSMRCSSTD